MAITHIGNAITQLLKNNSKLNKALQQHQIKKIIEKRLGDFFLKKGVHVKSINDKTIYIVCNHSSLKSEIIFRKNEILTEINNLNNAIHMDDIVLLNE